MSGYDPITYSVVTDWNIGYNILRHPLLPYMMLPFYLLNQLLWWITGANCVQLIVGSILFFCSFYFGLSFFSLLLSFRSEKGCGMLDKFIAKISGGASRLIG